MQICDILWSNQNSGLVGSHRPFNDKPMTVGCHYFQKSLKKMLEIVATPNQPASTSCRYFRIGKQSYQQALSIGFHWLLWVGYLPVDEEPPSMDPENNGV